MTRRVGSLVEYGLRVPPLAVAFSFGPQDISRSRTIQVKTGGTQGTRGGYDFMTPLEAPRAGQGVELQAETISISVLFDATDRIGEGDALARQFGIRPQLDTLRAMVEPKAQGPAGLQMLAAIGAAAGGAAFDRQTSASVLLFTFGASTLPVFLTSVTHKEVMHLPDLTPVRAEVQLTMQVIESTNPFTIAESVRQLEMVALNLATGAG
ncbi:MAG: hypothetical protein V4574_06150 [Pseudomonadota bacterium]